MNRHAVPYAPLSIQVLDADKVRRRDGSGSLTEAATDQRAWRAVDHVRGQELEVGLRRHLNRRLQ